MNKFTFDHPSNHEDKRMPVLDLKVHMDEEGFILHEFYEKPTKNHNYFAKFNWNVKKNCFHSRSSQKNPEYFKEA